MGMRFINIQTYGNFWDRGYTSPTVAIQQAENLLFRRF